MLCCCQVGVQLAIVLYIVVCRSKRSGRDKDASLYRIPKIGTHRGKQEY